MDEEQRLRRVAANEALFRRTNEHIEQITNEMNAALGSATDLLAIVCECADPACITRLDVARTAYERARAESTLFIIQVGHDAAGVENVVEQADGYAIVRKTPGPAVYIVERTDPRTP